MITAFYASLLGLFFTILTFRVLALRGVTLLKWLAFNNFGAQALERSVRAHGNFIEYVPDRNTRRSTQCLPKDTRMA